MVRSSPDSRLRATLEGRFALTGPYLSWVWRLVAVGLLVHETRPAVRGGDVGLVVLTLVAGAVLFGALDYLLMHPHYAPWNGFRPFRSREVAE